MPEENHVWRICDLACHGVGCSDNNAKKILGGGDQKNFSKNLKFGKIYNKVKIQVAIYPKKSDTNNVAWV